jgi:2-polyprenyl-3-methyl-5-hydroxy-6-metoxy-1,4-benzoquinol methylase
MSDEPAFVPEYEEVPCSVCGSSEYGPWRRLKDEPTSQCRRCGHIYANPRPTEASIIRAYALPVADYARFFKCEGFEVATYQRSGHAWQRSNALAHLHNIEQLRPEKGRLLELGCSSGILLEAAQLSGWDVAGVDPSALSSRGSEIDRRLNIQRTSLFDAPFSEQSFDFVFAASVIEHLTDPRRYLKKLANLLRPGGGILVAALPNIRSFTITLGIDRYIGNHPPGHLQFFSRQTIRLLMEATGFESVRARIYGIPETILEMLFGTAALTGAAPNPAELLEGRTLYARTLRASRRMVYSGFDFFGIGSVMDVHARRARS